MRILIGILSELSHERRLERMVASLERAGHTVATTWMDNDLSPRSAFWEGRMLHRLENPRFGRRKVYFMRFMTWMHGLIQRERPECVLAVDPPALAPALWALRRSAFRLVYDSREYYAELPTIRSRPLVQAFWRHWERRGMSRAQASFAVCGSIARGLEEAYGVSGVDVVRNLPERSWQPRAEDRRLFLEARVPGLGTGPVVLYAGGFWTGYDFRPLQEALGLMPRRLAGAPSLVYFGEGPEEVRHREHAATLPWRDRIHFAGKVPPEHLEDLMRGADVGTILVPDLGLSYRYLLPNKLFEYIQAGLPILTSPFPEMMAVVLGRGLGRCADPDNPAAIARELAWILDPDREQAFQSALLAAAGELCWEREEAHFLRLIEVGSSANRC